MAQQSVLHIDQYLDIERKRKDQHLLDWANDKEEEDKKEIEEDKKDGNNGKEQAQK